MIGILIYGSISSASFALIAMGFTLVYGVSRIANFAHGAFYVLTGFVAWIFIFKAGLNYWFALILALIVSALVGGAMYHFVLARVRGIPTSEIITSFAVGLAIMEGLRGAGFIGSTFMLPPFFDGSIIIGGTPVDYQRLIILAGGFAIVLVLWLFTHYTKTGLSLRAMAQDEHAAMMLGVDSDLMAVVALAIGSALAGIAAIALLPLGNITAAAGYEVLIYAIAVCILGGLGSWAGTLLSALLLGFTHVIINYVAPEYSIVVILSVIIIVLIFKPSGLFGKQKELEERI